MKKRRPPASELDFFKDEDIGGAGNPFDFVASAKTIYSRRGEQSRAEAAGIMLEFVANAETPFETRREEAGLRRAVRSGIFVPAARLFAGKR